MKCSGACRYGTHRIPHNTGRRSSLTRISFPVNLVVVLFCNPTRNLIVNRLGLWPPDYIKEGGVPGEGTEITQHFTINPTRKLTPTGHRAITRSWSRAQTKINRLSLAFTVEFCIRRSPNKLPQVPPWQAIGGEISTTGALGRGFRRICIRELDGP